MKWMTLALVMAVLQPQSELVGEQIRDESPHAPPKKEWEVPGKKVLPLVRRDRRFKFGRPFKDGILAGKTVYLSPGHGWTWTEVSGTYRWTTQRGWSYAIVEDLSNAESVDQFLIPCLMGAGAYVVTVRESDLNTNMVIVDNDDGGQTERGIYREEGDPSLYGTSSQATYAYQDAYTHDEEPFRKGTNRLIKTDHTATAQVVWVPNVPEDGYYNVYVSYSAWRTRAPDAHYIVRHPGGEAHFRVDQRRHGRTWVLLGRFWFKKGMNEDEGAIILQNDSSVVGDDVEVSADAVRLGGGMGLSLRSGAPSGHPRWEENCVTHAQFMGAPQSVYGYSETGDRTSDIGCRSRFAAWDHEDGEDAVYVSWHTNAGGGRGTSTYVYGHNPPDGSYNPDATPGSTTLARSIQDHVVAAFRHYFDPNWRDRGVFSAYFGELNPNNNGEMPAALLELLFHDSEIDTDWYKQPFVRYVAARQVCFAIIDYFADKDGKDVVYPPEPPIKVAAFNAGEGRVTVSWEPPPPMEYMGDEPDGYMVYIGTTAHSYDEGRYVAGTSFTLENVEPGKLIFFRVTAVNDGGESLPSAPVAVYTPQSGQAPVLLVDAFDALTPEMAPMIDDGYSQGPVFRMILERMNFWREGIGRHAEALAKANIPFDTVQVEALRDGLVDWNSAHYEAVDVMAGRGMSPDAADTLASWLEDAINADVAVFVNGNAFGHDMVDAGLSSSMQNLFGITGVSEGGSTITFAGTLAGVPASTISYGFGFYDGRPTESYDGQADVTYENGAAAGVFAHDGSVFILGASLEALANVQTRVDLLKALMLETFGITEEPDHGGDATDTDDDTDEGDATDTGGGSTDTRDATDEREYRVTKVRYVVGCAVSPQQDGGSMAILLAGAIAALAIALRRRRR